MTRTASHIAPTWRSLLAQDEALSWQASFKSRPPSEAIVFVVGGSTYEEAKAVAEWNARAGPASGMRVLLGGSEVLNSDGLLAALGAGASGGGGGGGLR